MEKSQFQKKLRFIIMILCAALFVGILLPAYWKYNKGSYPTCIMMWTVIFGAGGSNARYFNFSWIGFTPLIIAFIMIIIWLARTFLVVEANDKKKEKGKNDAILDSINFILSIIMLLMFILLAVTIKNVSVTGIGSYLLNSIYGISVGYIFFFIVGLAIVVCSFMSLYADAVLKIIKKRK